MTLVPWKGKKREGEVERYTPGSALGYFRSQMNDLFDRFFQDVPDRGVFGADDLAVWHPSLDVTETDTDVTVRVELPGVDPKNLEVSVSGDRLTIAGEKEESSENKGENFYHTERRFGSFKRSVQLPASVDAEKITAEHKIGVLTIAMKKVEGAVHKRIPVKSS